MNPIDVILADDTTVVNWILRVEEPYGCMSVESLEQALKRPGGS